MPSPSISIADLYHHHHSPLQICTIIITLHCRYVPSSSSSIADLYHHHHSPLQICAITLNYRSASLSIAHLYKHSPLQICTITLHCGYVPMCNHHPPKEIFRIKLNFIVPPMYHQHQTITINYKSIQSISIVDLYNDPTLQIYAITLNCRSVPSL